MALSTIFNHPSASVYARRRNSRFIAPGTRALLESLTIDPDDMIMDISLDQVMFALPLARYLTTSRGRGVVFGCDDEESQLREVDAYMVETGVSHHFCPVQVETGVGLKLPFYDEQIDAILCVDRLTEKRDLEAYFREFSRVLKPCGTLLLAQSNMSTSFDKVSTITRLSKPEDFYPALDATGFDIRISFDVNNYVFVTRAMKPVVTFA